MSTELVKETNRYEGVSPGPGRNRGANEHSWLQNLRENSFIQFERAGFPDIKHEEWKTPTLLRLLKKTSRSLEVTGLLTKDAPYVFHLRKRPGYQVGIRERNAAQSRVFSLAAVARHQL